jgi:hypothetical protein
MNSRLLHHSRGARHNPDDLVGSPCTSFRASQWQNFSALVSWFKARNSTPSSQSSRSLSKASAPLWSSARMRRPDQKRGQSTPTAARRRTAGRCPPRSVSLPEAEQGHPRSRFRSVLSSSPGPIRKTYRLTS